MHKSSAVAFIGPRRHKVVFQTTIAVFLNKEKHAQHPPNTRCSLCITKQDMIKNNLPSSSLPTLLSLHNEQFGLRCERATFGHLLPRHLLCFYWEKENKPSVTAAALSMFNIFFLSRQMIHCLTISKFK